MTVVARVLILCLTLLTVCGHAAGSAAGSARISLYTSTSFPCFALSALPLVSFSVGESFDAHWIEIVRTNPRPRPLRAAPLVLAGGLHQG